MKIPYEQIAHRGEMYFSVHALTMNSERYESLCQDLFILRSHMDFSLTSIFTDVHKKIDQVDKKITT